MWLFPSPQQTKWELDGKDAWKKYHAPKCRRLFPLDGDGGVQAIFAEDEGCGHAGEAVEDVA